MFLTEVTESGWLDFGAAVAENAASLPPAGLGFTRVRHYKIDQSRKHPTSVGGEGGERREPGGGLFLLGANKSPPTPPPRSREASALPANGREGRASAASRKSHAC